MRIEYHRTLLADKVRNAAFETALRKRILPGETVVADIGAGTGYLGLLAAKIGAREVFLYEAAEVAEVADAVLKANDARNCHLFPCSSMDMGDPPLVDLIVSETLGNYPLEEDIVATLNDARARHLKPGGHVIPSRITQYACPVVADRLHDELTVWRRVHSDMDLSCPETMSLNNAYVRSLRLDELFEAGRAAQVWDQIDLTKEQSPDRSGELVWPVDHTATIYGFVTWWACELAPGVTLSTAPSAPRTHWEQLYFPLQSPLEVAANDEVEFTIHSTSSPDEGTDLSWSGAVLDPAGAVRVRHSHSLDQGYLP